MTKTILLADESATIRRIVELTFSESEYRIESVSNGAEALARLEAARPDLVMADVTMPAPGGYELCRQIKQSGQPVPVLLLAGAFEPFDEQLADRCGADGHLVKPFESVTLVGHIETLLASPPRTLATPPAARSGEAEGRAAPESSVVQAAAGDGTPGHLAPADVRAIAREVVALMSDEMIRDIAAAVVPEVADRVVRERIRELEAED